jgi:MFS family permease
MKLQPIQKFYLMNSVYGLAGSFIGVFVPIFFLTRGVSVRNILIYYLIYGIGVLLFFFLANFLSRQIGLRKTVLSGFPILFIYFLLLYTFDTYHASVFLIGAISSLQAALYWFPFHMWLVGSSKDASIGKELSQLFAFSKSIGIYAPLISSLVIVLFGFRSLFIVSALIYLCSIIPLLSLEEHPNNAVFNWSDLIRLTRSYPYYVWAELIENIREDAEGIIWPIFVFLTFKNILTIGYVETIASIGAILFSLFVGKAADRSEKSKLLYFGVLIIGSIWIIRLFVHSEFSFYALSLAVGFFESLIMIPLNAVVYSVARKEGGANFILFREFIVAVGRIMLYIFALILVNNIRYIFLLPAVSSLYFLYVAKKNLSLKKEGIYEVRSAS